MSFKVHTFGTPLEAARFLNGGIVGGTQVVNIGGRVLGLNGKTLVFNTPSGTVTFSDASGAGLTYQQVKTAIETALATLTVSFDRGRMRIVDSGGTVSLDSTGTANGTFGFSSGSDTVGVSYAAPGGAPPVLVSLDADTVNNTWTALVAEAGSGSTTGMASAFLIPRTVELDGLSGTTGGPLPAAGAYTAQGLSPLPAGTKRVSYWVQYTGNSATSKPKFRVEFTNGTETAGEMILDPTSVAASSGGYATANVYVETLVGSAPGASPASWSGIVQVLLPDGATGIRLKVAEAGDTANPGTVKTAFAGSGGAGA